jgi:hypothetical protein
MTTTNRPPRPDTKKRWTHTATLRRTTSVGPEQFNAIAPAGVTVQLWQDPALQQGDLISIRYGHYTGAARLTDLTDVQVKS